MVFKLVFVENAKRPVFVFFTLSPLFANRVTNRPFFTNCFSEKLASKISVKFPWNWPFFPQICPWKSREIWLFFRDLAEALNIIRKLLGKEFEKNLSVMIHVPCGIFCITNEMFQKEKETKKRWESDSVWVNFFYSNRHCIMLFI